MSTHASLEAVAPLIAEYEDLEKQLADPTLHSNQARARKVGRRYAELGRIVKLAHTLAEVDGDLAAA